MKLFIIFSVVAYALSADFPLPRYHTVDQDHFDGTNTQTWQQAYYVNDTFFVPGSDAPVFVCVGGEGPPLDGSVVVDSVHCNVAVEWLQETKALMLAVEHRYYGCHNTSACPVKDTRAPGALRYLSSRQALGDLAAFHAHVRVLKRTLRELTEACLCNVMLQDPSHADSLRDNLLNPSDSSRHDGAKALLPTFMLPRTCMGIVWKYLLDYNPTGEVNKETLKAELRTKFACTQDPVTDIQKSIVFWREVHRCVAFIAEPLGVTEFAASMDHANKIVEAKCKQFGLVPESG